MPDPQNLADPSAETIYLIIQEQEQEQEEQQEQEQEQEEQQT